MRRLGLVLSVTVAVLLGIVAVSPSPHIRAQDGTPTADHPLIGAWLADVEATNPGNAPSLIVFHDDGTYLQINADGSTGIGAWAATGPTAATLTAVFLAEDETGAFGGSATVRVAIEVEGDTLSAQYTLDFTGPDGVSTGEMGPESATAERILVEAMGTPVAPMEMEETGTPTSG